MTRREASIGCFIIGIISSLCCIYAHYMLFVYIFAIAFGVLSLICLGRSKAVSGIYQTFRITGTVLSIFAILCSSIMIAAELCSFFYLTTPIIG